MATTTVTSNVRIKSVAVPPEHGSWGFLLEPLLLGLIIAPSWGGVWFALGVIGAFLARHPLKIVWADRRKGKRYARTRLAERFALGYGALGLAGVLAAIALAGIDILLPVLLAAPLGLAQIAGYASNRGRELLPELAGASAIAVSAASIALAGGESLAVALVLWAILVARDIPSILYIRERLHLDKGKPHSPALVWIANGLAVLAVLILALAGLAPWLAVVALAILLVRAGWGLSPFRRRVRVPILGVLELIYGLLTVLLTALGFAL